MNIEIEIYKRISEAKKDEKTIEWKRKILNTKMELFGLYAKEVESIIKEFKSADFRELKKRNCFELNQIYLTINLIQMKNLAEQELFLKNNTDIIDSWAITDCTYQHLKIKKFEEAITFFDEFSNTNIEMLIRYAYLVLFKFKNCKEYLQDILGLFKDSSFYYVNMVEAWLLSFLYISFPSEVYEYLKDSTISNDIKLKAISKICDSFRVSDKDKNLVKQLRYNFKGIGVNL
ncbi:MAG: DNA alkylation repair protein [Bacilli bacterium]|nr:DNA alkylation repair protein [Bacilli bacterium]